RIVGAPTNRNGDRAFQPRHFAWFSAAGPSHRRFFFAFVVGPFARIQFAVAELAVFVAAPGPHGLVRHERDRVRAPRIDRPDRAKAGDLDGRGAAFVRTVTELTVIVSAPRLDGAFSEEREAEV